MMKLKDVLSKGIAGISTSGYGSVEKKEKAKKTPEKFPIESFIINDNNVVIKTEEDVGSVESGSMQSIVGKVKISGGAGGITIQKIDDGQDDEKVIKKEVVVEKARIVTTMQRPQDVLRQWSEFSQLQLETMDLIDKELKDTASVIWHGAQRANQKINSLAESVKFQGEQIQEIAEIAINGGKIPVEKALEVVNQTINDDADKRSLVSAKITSVVNILEEARKSLAATEKFIQKIQSITNKTNLFAMNAAIEASKIGASGAGTEKIVEEAREFIREIESVSSELGAKINGVVLNVDSGYEILKIISEVEALENSASKEKIGAVIQDILQQGADIGREMQEKAGNLQKTSNSISGLGGEMQFSDRTSQHLENVRNVLNVMAEKTESHKNNAVMSLGMKISKTDIPLAVIEEMVKGFTLNQLKKEFVTYLIKSGYIQNAASVGHKEFDMPYGSNENEEKIKEV